MPTELTVKSVIKYIVSKKLVTQFLIEQRNFIFNNGIHQSLNYVLNITIFGLVRFFFSKFYFVKNCLKVSKHDNIHYPAAKLRNYFDAKDIISLF